MRYRAVLLSGLVFGALACDEAPPAADECVEVRAPDAWVDADPPRWVELWRSGGPDSGVELALPIMIAPAPDGRLAIADFQLGLGGVDRDGAWAGSLTRPGEGPGEVQMPLAAAYAADGTLAVLDFGDGKVVFLDEAGDLVRALRVDPMPLARVVRNGAIVGLGFAADGTVLLLDREALPAEGRVRQALLRLPPDGSPPDTMVTASVPSAGSDDPTQIAPGWARLVSAASPGGRIAYAGHVDGYVVRVLDPGGEWFEFCRNVAPSPVRPDEIEPPPGLPPDRRSAYAEALDGAPRPEVPAAISRLLQGRNGRLWVERERFGLADGPAAFLGRPGSLFDVFDAEGRYLGGLRAPEGVHVMAAAGDTVWGLEYGAFDVPFVISYRLER